MDDDFIAAFLVASVEVEAPSLLFLVTAAAVGVSIFALFIECTESEGIPIPACCHGSSERYILFACFT